MISAYLRMIIKFILFIGISSFIVIFVVYGYRYHDEMGFIQKNVFLKFNFWSNDNYLKIDNNTYKPQNKEVSLYNMDNGCYDITHPFNKKICIDKDQSFLGSAVSYINTKKVNKTANSISCKDVNNKYFTNNKCIKDKCFSENISNVFSYRKINFIHLEKTLLYCNKGFSNCNKLTDIKGDILCADKKGLYFYNLGVSLVKLK